MKGSLALFIICIFLLPQLLFAQAASNRWKNNERHGKWVTYHDSAETKTDQVGRYRKGIPKGKWRYYDAAGNLVKVEKHRFKKISTRQYHSNGNLLRKGKAKIVLSDSLYHFYYYGTWKVYDAQGKLLKLQEFREGTKISEIMMQKSTVNDSLVKLLRTMDAGLSKYSDSLLIEEQKNGRSSANYQKLQSLSNLNSIFILKQLDSLLSTSGYPGKTLAGDDYAIAFSIISRAPLSYKEKYLDMIVNAANQEELDWADVAFFVDKIKVGKKQKQVYGTQYQLNLEQNTIVFYPIEEPARLNERRKKAGLENMDLSRMQVLQTY
jgi:antitoxin component YwqK of YwqJK toxin-antitoxin module